MPSARLAVDIGGTFTDLALEHDGRRTTIKVLTTPAAPEQGVMAGVRAILPTAGVAPADIGIVIHGTTLATNAVIERKGARTALITTAGLPRRDRDGQRKPLRPVRPQHRAARAAGAAPSAPAGAGAAGQRRQRAAAARRGGGARAGAGAAARARREHRRRLPARLRQSARTSAACATSWPRRCRTFRCRCPREVSPEMREWERFSTTVANAYVQPLMARYLRGLADGLRELGVAGAAVPDAVGRRADHDRDRLPLPDPPGGKRPGRRRDLLRAPSRGNAASTTCCRSTWAAPPRRSA